MGDLLPHCSQSGSLLLLQRNAAVARALARLLGRYFATVSVAHTPEEAERVLERREATHLICGQDFGDGQPLGQDLILAWRGRYPSLEQVILASGAEGLPSNLLGVDGIYQKSSSSLSDLLRLLHLTTPLVDEAGDGAQLQTPHRKQTIMKTQNTSAHALKTLKQRLAESPKQDERPGSLRSAQGFAVT